MKTIWRFPLDSPLPFNYKEQIIEVDGYVRKVLYAGLDPTGQPSIWVVVIPSEGKKHNFHKEKITVWTVGTGCTDLPGEELYINSFNQGNFVWHVYAN